MKIEGACHCGYITYEAEIDLEKVGICHCTDCQTLSGSAFRTLAFTREGTFELLTGELKIYVKTSASGNQRPQSFCPECGTPIYSTSTEAGTKGAQPACRYHPAARRTASSISVLDTVGAELDFRDAVGSQAREAIIGAGILVCVRILTPFARRASAVGIVMVFVWLGHGISAYQGGFLFDLSGEYTLTYARTALAGIINLMIVGSLYVTITRRRSARAFADAWGTSALAASPIKRARRPSPP